MNIFERYFGTIILSCSGLLAVPLAFYISNASEFENDALLLAFSMLPVALLIGLCIFIRPPVKVQLFMAGLGLAIFICDQFLRADIRHLDGSGGLIKTELTLQIANAIVYFGLPITLVLFGFKFRKIFADIAFLSLVSVVAGLIYVGYTALSASPYFMKAEASQSLTSSSNSKEASEKPNIYFIWLDAMESGYLKKYLNQSGNDNKYPGFTFFKNNSSNYLYTVQSYPSFMSGTIFSEGSYKTWSEKSDLLRKAVSENGYNLNAYARKDFLSELDDVSISSDRIYKNATSAKHPLASDYITYSIVRMVPSLIVNPAKIIARHIGNTLHAMVNPVSEFSMVKTINDGIEPLTGILTLQKLLEDESRREDTNEFVLVQAIIPHGPYVIDRNCIYRGMANIHPSEAYYEQVECAASLLEKFFEKLKLLNRYDSSIIVVMGDHGAGWAGLVNGYEGEDLPLNARYTPWSKSMIMSRSSAALMIKPPAAASNNGSLLFSERETQLVDIAPTLLSLSEIQSENFNKIDGVDVFQSSYKLREKYITYFKPARILNPYDAEIYDLEYLPDSGISNIIYRRKFRDYELRPSLTCGQIISFSDVTQSAEYIVESGLSIHEHWGRWSDSKIVNIEFKFNKSNCDITSLNFSLRAFLAANHTSQSAIFYLNDKRVGSAKFSLGQVFPFDVMLDISSNSFEDNSLNVLRIEISNPISPASLGVSADKRKLGLGFETMVIK